MVFHAVAAGAALLSAVVATSPAPWLRIEADSEQRSPIYAGANPRQMAIQGQRAGHPMLHSFLKDKAIKGAQAIRNALELDTVELEAWPVQADEGNQAWAFARYRQGASEPWQWLDARDLRIREKAAGGALLPLTLKPWRSADESKIFDDFLTLKSLYDKPVFGECVWTSEDGRDVVAGWLPPAKSDEYKAELTRETEKGRRNVCRVLPQLARFNDAPVSFVIRAERGRTLFQSGIEWYPNEVGAAPYAVETVVREWPSNFEDSYRLDVQIIAGEKIARFPMSGRVARFTRKNTADGDNRLGVLISYLEERYARLGFKTFRQNFEWRGIREANLIAVIPGTNAESKPVLLADHIDTAFAEDEFARSGERVSAPGADDNGTAVAALLRAAEILRDRHLRHDVWLVHLTGEEFPGDCLGARYFVSSLLKKQVDIRGLVLMDMIGYRDPKTGGLFQVNAGDSSESVQLARFALDASHSVAPDLTPVFRSRWDERSYLYNTDGIIFSQAGYPVILLNEHINKLENLNRPHYHQTSDTSDKLDFRYAASIVKVAIETAARLAE